MVIKAGTYRFNYSYTDIPRDAETNINFTMSVFSATDNSTIYCPDTFDSLSLSVTDNSFAFASEDDVSIKVDGTQYIAKRISFFKQNNAYYARIYLGTITFEDFEIASPPTINVIYDVDVTEDDVAMVNWFTENTKMLIKSGTYKWYDVLTDPLLAFDTLTGQEHIGHYYVDVELPISEAEIPQLQQFAQQVGITSPVPQEAGTYKLRVNSGSLYTITSNALSYITGLVECEPYNEFFTYFIWFAGSNGRYSVYFNSKWLNKKFQIITIVDDYYVSTRFGLWAYSNWQPYVEPIPTENAIITLTYKEVPFLTITNGEITTPITSATSVEIPTKDYSFTENIKIEITKT